MAGSRLRTATLALAALVLAGNPAQGLPVVFTAGGRLGNSGAGTDTIQLNGATVRITLHADTADAPASTSADATSLTARYHPSSGSLVFTNRPGGAVDLVIPYTPDLLTVNLFEPSASPDRFELSDGSTTTGVPGSAQFFVAGFALSFIDAGFYPGTAAGPLPDFDVTGGAVVYGFFYDLSHVALYPLNAPVFEIRVVPEPGPALLLVAGLAVLAARPRRRAR